MNRPSPFVFRLTLATIAALLAACSDPLTPVQPTWDVDLNVPLVSQTYTMSRLLEDDSSLDIVHDATNLLVLRKSFSINGVAVGDRIALGNTSFREHLVLGGILFDIPLLCDRSVYLGDVFPTLQEGRTVVIPLSTTDGIDIPLDNTRYFSEVAYDAGEIRFTVYNTFPFAISFPKPAVVRDDQGREVTSISISDRIAPFSQLQLPAIRLDGLTLTGAMTVRMDVATLGSNGVPVDITRDMGVRIVGEITGTRIRRATGFLPSQTLAWTGAVEMTDASGSQVREGTIKQGSLDMTLVGHLPVGCKAEIDLTGLTMGGMPVHRTATIGARGSTTVSIDLAGAALQPRDGRHLDYHVSLTSDPSMDRQVTLASTDSVSVDVRLNDIIMAHMAGVIAPREITIDQAQDINFDIMSKLQGDIEFSEARIAVRLDNGTVFPVELLSGSLRGSNKATQRSAVIDIPRSTIAGKGQSLVQLDGNQVVAFLNTFAGNLPDHIAVNGRLMVNPGSVMGELNSTDSISATLEVEIPMHFKINSGSVSDTTAITIDNGNRERMANIGEGSIIFDLENHLPAGVSVEPVFCDEQYRPIFTPKTVDGGDITIAAANVDGTGNVSSSARQKLELRLTKEDFRKVLAGKWMRVRVNLKTPSASPVAFRTTDYVKVRAYATVKVQSTIVGK